MMPLEEILELRSGWNQPWEDCARRPLELRGMGCLAGVRTTNLAVAVHAIQRQGFAGGVVRLSSCACENGVIPGKRPSLT